MRTNNNHLERLLGQLDDDMDFLVSLQSIAGLLNQRLIDEQNEFRESFSEFQPESRKYWTALQDHLHERRGHLAGLFFVLAQTALTQTVSILNAIRAQTSFPLSLPANRPQILKTNAPVEVRTNLSIFTIVDATANYYKHHPEWPDDWTGARGPQQRTIELVIECGMQPAWFPDNLQRAFDLLDRDPKAIIAEISDWRHGLAREIYKELQIDDPILALEAANQRHDAN